MVELIDTGLTRNGHFNTTSTATPIRPPSLHSHYPACDWSQTTAPRSDALLPGHLHHACPRCGCKDLQVQAANPTQVLLAWVRQAMRLQ